MTLTRVVTLGSQAELQPLARRISSEIFVADDLAEVCDIIKTAKPDLVLLDQHLGPAAVRTLLDKTDKNAHIPVVVVAHHENHTFAPEDFIRAGAYDYLPANHRYRLPEIVNQIKNGLDTNTPPDNTNCFFADELSACLSIVGRSKAILNMLNMIKLVAASRCNPILILGETGTGKELAARALHFLRHPNEQFIAVNCAALTSNLLESELFGHVKGAFTGADREKIGLFELAQTGTIFLDEISEMPTNLQAKLLRVLQEKNFRKVGGTKDICCRATIIASTNRNLKTEVRDGRFRQDLYYRLNLSPITIAPLKSSKRRKDIPLLAQYFLKTSTICPEKQNKITCLTKLAIESLEKHDWPGNARELKNVIERAILLEKTDKIGLASILIDTDDYDDLNDNAIENRFSNFSLEKAERELITRALQQTGWQKTRAAELLGITRATLYAKVKHHHIKKDPYLNTEPENQPHEKLPTNSLPEPATLT